MPRTAPTPARTRSQAGSLRVSSNWQENVDRLFDTIEFRPEQCVGGGLLELCADEPVTKTITPSDGPVTAPVHGLWEGSVCSTAADPDQILETAARAQAALEVSLYDKIEEALWTGGAYGPFATVADLGALTSLASPGADDINSGVAVGVVTGIGNMIEVLDAVLGGGRGTIHIPQWAMVHLNFYGLVSRNGNILSVANTDHLIVAGTGYTGSDPDGNPPNAGETWIYGTGPVNVLLSDELIPDPQVDRSVNEIEVRAERTAAVYFSPCAHIGLPICLPDPGPECEVS